jgi:hypothetical protein
MKVPTREAADAVSAHATEPPPRNTISGIWETESPTAREVPQSKGWFRFTTRRLSLPPPDFEDDPPSARGRELRVVYRVPNVALLLAWAAWTAADRETG